VSSFLLHPRSSPPPPISRPTHKFHRVGKQTSAAKLDQATMTGGPGGATGAAAKDKGGKGKAKGPVSGLFGKGGGVYSLMCCVPSFASEE
jgi:hypothetical protein